MAILTFNLVAFGFLLGVYLLMLLAYNLMGYWYNKKNLHETFDKARFWDGLKTGLVTLAGMLCFVIAAALVPQALIFVGLVELAESFGMAFSVLIMGGIVFNGINKYATAALDRLRGIIEGTTLPGQFTPEDDDAEFEDDGEEDESEY